VLLALWLGCLLADGLWVSQHHLPPAWDQGDHLSRALGFWQVLQQPAPWSGEWWVSLWNQSPSYRGPLTYLVTAPVFSLLGPGFGAAILSNSLFNGLLLASVYGLGRLAHSRAAGLWAALVLACAPALLNQRSDYLIDFSLTAVLTACWWLLSVAVLTQPMRRWLWAGACGLGLGFVVLTRPTGVVLLWLPLVALGWTALAALLAPPRLASGRRSPRRWGPLGRCALALAAAAAIGGPWFSQNWLTILSTVNKARQWGVAYQEGMGATSLAGWLYYPQLLPTMLGQTLVALVAGGALVALVLAWRRGWRPGPWPRGAQRQAWLWWLSFPLGGLLVCVLMTSKDFRFVLPLLPQLGLALGVVTAQTAAQARPWIRPWQGVLVVVALSGLLSNHFALGPNLTGFAPHPPRGERGWPVEAIVATIRSQSPHQLSTLAVLPDHEFLNAFNLDAEGRRQQFKVAARQTLAPLDQLQDDLAGFDWFLLKGGHQGVMSDERQAKLSELVSHSAAFEPAGQWPLPDGSRADLYRRRQLGLEVKPIDWTAGQTPSLVASLQAPAPERLEPRAPAPSPEAPSANALQRETGDGLAPQAFRAGEPLGLTLELQGPSQQLASGLLLMEWRPRAASPPGTIGTDAASPGATSWRGDHAIGQGMVRAQPPGGQPRGRPSPGGLRIQEHLALQLPTQLAPGTYQLQAQLLTPKGQVLPLRVSAPSIQVAADINKPTEAPPLAANRITVLRQLGQQLRAGQLDPLFARVGQLNQTDPDQVYLRDGAAISAARLRQDPRNLDDLYALALAQALQRQADAAAASLARILPLDPSNPHALLGLAVVDLYRFKPGAARPLLERAAQLDPNNETLRTLRIVASAMGLDWGHALSLLHQSSR
jgi:4-amino-4-deoxy-L-arabinose transferase-like glycosyltransferase